MNLRGTEIYVSREVNRLLRMIAKSRTTAMKPMTKDETADELLRKIIQVDYPTLVEADRRYKALEQDMIQAAARDYVMASVNGNVSE